MEKPNRKVRKGLRKVRKGWFLKLSALFAGCFFADFAVNVPANTKYDLVCKIPLNGASFTTDNLQNIYIFKGSSLKKFNSTGNLLFTLSDKTYGDITTVDTYDPMKLLVFYRDFPEIVLLDNTLSQNGDPFSPSDAGFSQATVACTSHDNGIWLYDAQNFQLVRLDVNLNVVEKTGNIAQVLSIQLNPSSIVEYNNFIYLNDSAQGVLVFDSFGAYYKTLPFTGLTTFQVTDENFYYIHQNSIHVFQLKTFMEDVIQPPDALVPEGSLWTKSVRVEKNMLFENYKDTLRVFNIK